MTKQATHHAPLPRSVKITTLYRLPTYRRTNMPFTLDDCRTSTASQRHQARKEYGVSKYRDELRAKVNDLCLLMGAFCYNNKKQYDVYAAELKANILGITDNDAEQEKIYIYTLRLLEIAQEYFKFHPIEAGMPLKESLLFNGHMLARRWD